jgi:hypothetical protein
LGILQPYAQMEPWSEQATEVVHLPNHEAFNLPFPHRM